MMKEEGQDNAFDRGRVFSKRKRPNQDCIDALIDQRDEARGQLLEAKKNNHWLLWTNTLLVCSILAKPLIQWVIQ